MVAYSFKKRFVQPMLDGIKDGTIRADRKRHAREGEEIQLYQGMRTKHCLLIGRQPCVGAWPIKLWFAGHDRVMISNRVVEIDRPRELDAFAVKDGFSDWADMKGFWFDEHEVVDSFSGQLIRWRPIGAALFEHGKLAQPSMAEEID